MPYTISAEESRRFNVSRALEILPDAPDAEKVWGVRTLAGQARMTLPAEFTSNPSDALSRLQEAYRTNSIEPLQTDDFKETETLLREGNWDELAKRGAANDSYFVQAGDALGADNDTDIELLDEKDRDTAKMLKARLRDIDTESRIADMSGRGVNSANGTDQKAAIDLYNKQVKERNQIGRELQPLVDEARKRAAAMRHVQRVRQKNAFTLLNSISGDLDDRTREIVDRAVANGYRLADGDEDAFALPEARGGLPESQKELAASFLLYCKPVEGKGAWDAFVKRMGDNAAQVVGNTASGVGDLFSGVFHGFDKDSYRDRVNRRAWVNRINARNFADLGTLGNSFAEAGGIIGYWTPQLIGGAVGRGTRLLAGANRLGAVARVAGKAAGVIGFINRWGPEAMYFADYRQQFLERVALDGGDVTNPAFQVAATVGAAASAYVEHIQWGRAMGKVGLEEVQAQAYAKLSHRILAKLGIKVGTEFGSMTAGRAARLVLMERGLSAVTEGFEEAIQQAIEETVVQIGDGQGIRLADIADQSGEAFVSTLGPMMWTMMFGLPFRAKSSATMHNLDGDAIDRLMSASSRLKRLAAAGKLDQGGDDLASLNELLFVTSRAPNADAGVRSLRERGFSQAQAADIWNTFEAIRREAIQHGQMDALGRNVLPTGEELRRTGWEVTDNPDGTTTASRIVETADGRKRRQTINVRSEASQSVDIGDDSQAVSTLNTIRQEVAGRTAPSVSEDGTPGVIPLADKIAATYGFDLSLDNDAILADPAMREGLARYAVDQDLRVSGNTRLAETRKAKDADGNEIDEDVFDVPLTELATRQTIFHEVAHAVAATLRNMGLTEKEIDAIQNWRSGIDGKTPSEADMALPQVEGEAWDEERVGDELGDKLTEPDERGRVARAMNYIGDMTRRILGIRKEQQNLRDAVSVLEEAVRRGYFGNIDELNDAQRRVLLAARQKRAEDRARREAEPPAPAPAEGAVIAPAPPPEETNPSEIPTGSENPNDSESETPPAEEPKSVLDRAIDAFCTNRPLQSDEMAALAASGEVTQDEIYETGYRWHYAANAWVISPEAVGQKFVPSRRYRGLDGKWHDTRRDGGRRYAVASRVTPEEDAVYVDAVNRGDMETAQKMVREAATRAMPNTKVVGENGLPKVVYHGTPKYGFTVFRENAVGSTNDPGAYGRGYYFTEIKDDAEGYKKPGIAAAFENYHNNVVGDNSAASNRTTTAGIYEVFLNIRNPKIIRSHEDAVAFRKEFRIFPEDNLTESEKEAIQKEVAKESERISEDDWAYDEEESRIEKERALKARIQNESLERLRQAYDGVIVIRDGMFKEIVAFQSAQIKSADPVTRDDAGNVIPLSQRFNPERDDIRFSVSSSRRPSPEFAMDGTIADALPAHLREDARAIIEERANTPAWMADPDGTPTDLNERDWLRREAERRHGASVTPHGVQKQAGVAYPDASSEIVRFSIGAKRREEYAGLLARKRPDLDAEAVLAELDKFDEPKKEKIALHWIVRGGLQLPEDAYKVDDALDVAAKAKVDPFAYKSPDELLLANKQFKPSARPIDPATVPELSDPRDEGDGIVSYLVQDDRDGQKAMRRIIDTHWGEDANPWCLLHGDGHGNLSDGSNGGYNAWKYWNHYSALPKRVAFKNGRLLAFMATEGKVQEHEYALPTRQQALEQAEEIREERQADHSNDDDATALQNDIEEFEKLSRELSGGLTTELADRLYDLFDQHNSGGVFSYVDSYAPTDTDISVPDGFMDRLYDYRFSDDGKDEDGNVILSNGDEDVMSEALEALAKAAQDVLDSHIEWLDNEYPVTIFERDSSVFVEQDGETIAEIEFQPPDDSRSDIPEEWWDRQDESHPDLDWAREGRAAVAGRVRAFDNEPQFSPRASLAAVATMELLAGKEPDRDALEQMRNRLGLKADVDEVIGEAKAMLDSEVGEIARRGAGRNPGAVAVAIAESVQASHPEDLVREAFMAGANAQKWAQGTRGAALNALVRNARGDNYADLVMETGVDATGVLQSFPDMVRRRRAERKEPPPAPAGERPNEATEAKPAAAGEPPSLADIGPIDPNSPEGRRIAAIQEQQEANIEKAIRETEKEMELRRLDAWLENADKRDEEAAKKSAKDDVDEDGDGGDADLDESDESGVSRTIRIPVEVLERNLVDVSDPETFTLWLRKIVRNRILKANGMSTDFPDLAAAQAAERDLWANPTNVAAFAKSMSAILRDMARRMLDHRSGAYTEVLRKAATLPHYDNVDAIEDEVAFEVRVMSGASISQTSTRLVNETRRKLKRDFIGATKPNEHPELQDDLVRKITGHVREMAKWYRNVLALTEGGVEKMRDTLEARLEERGRNLDEAGMTSATDRENDAVWDWTNWKLNVLDRFGGTRYLLPAEARERLAEIETWMAKEGMAWAQKMEAMTAQYEADRKTIIDGCRIVDREGRTVKHEKDTKFEGFWRYTVNTIDQRLRLLFARAGGDAGRAAKALRDRTSLRLAQGTTRYEREKQEMHRALVQTVRNVVGPRDVRAWIERMTQEIPEEQAIALSKQNNRHLTYGQVMHLYGYLRQTATYGENIAKFGREEQRDYIERNVLTAEDIKILDGIMQIYADNRRALDEASRDISGFPIKNPDPFYLPVKIKQKARSGLETTVSTVQAMPDVFSERRRHGLDVDEKADIMVMFYDRMEQTARVLGFGRTGLDIIHTFGSADVKEAITEARGAKFTTALIAHFTDWMNGGRPRLVTKEGDDAAVLNSLRTAFVYSALWGNTLSAFKQTLSAPVFSLAREAGERGVFRDMMGVFSDGWLQAKAELTQSDPWKVRYGDVGVMQETKEAVKGAGDGTIWQAILRAGMQPLQWGDATPAILCQVTAYKVERDRLIEEGMEPEEAKRLAADKAMQQVEWTQQSSRAENLPEYSRRGSSAMRMMMMFASSPMLQAGWEVQRFAEWREKREAFGADAKETKDAAAALWNAVVVNHVVMPVLFQTATAIFNLALGKEPPDEKDAIELAFNMLIGPFARLVFFGGMAKGVWNAAWSQGLYGRSDVVPSLLTNSEQNVKDVLVNIPVDLFRGDMDEALADIDKFLKRNVAPYRHVRQAVENWSE